MQSKLEIVKYDHVRNILCVQIVNEYTMTLFTCVLRNGFQSAFCR